MLSVFIKSSLLFLLRTVSPFYPTLSPLTSPFKPPSGISPYFLKTELLRTVWLIFGKKKYRAKKDPKIDFFYDNHLSLIHSLYFTLVRNLIAFFSQRIWRSDSPFVTYQFFTLEDLALPFYPPQVYRLKKEVFFRTKMSPALWCDFCEKAPKWGSRKQARKWIFYDNHLSLIDSPFFLRRFDSPFFFETTLKVRFAFFFWNTP